MQKQTDPKIKGLITAAIGYIGIPMLVAKAKLGGKGAKADLMSHVGEGVGIVGVMQLANAFVPPKPGGNAIFPTISGYEENPISGLGMITEEDDSDQYENVSGYEMADDVVS